MKQFIYFFFTIQIFAGCKNNNSVSRKLVCSQQSDLFYEGYKGPVKKIIKYRGFPKGNEKNIPSDYYVKTTRFYDKQGQLTFEEDESVSPSDVYSSQTKVFRDNKQVIRTLVVDDTVIGIDSFTWINGSSQIVKTYAAGENALSLHSFQEYQFNASCLVQKSHIVDYYDSDGKKSIPVEEYFDEKTLTPVEKEAREKYGYLSRYYKSEKIKILSTDSYGNPTKVSSKFGGVYGLDSLIYEYYK